MRDHSPPKEIVQSLYDLYSNDIYRYAKTMLGESDDAYDVVQEVFLRALRSWDSYRQDANPKTWLMSIARNYIYDVLRKKRTERKYISQQEPSDISDSSPPMDVAIEVEKALSQLKNEYGHVIVLRHIDNLSIEQTASVLGWSERKVRNTAHRALKKLREILGARSEEVDMANAFRTRNF